MRSKKAKVTAALCAVLSAFLLGACASPAAQKEKAFETPVAAAGEEKKPEAAEAADTEAADEETEAAESGAAADSSEGEVSNLPQSIPGAKSGTRRVLPHEEKSSESTAKNDENSFPELNEVKAPAEITGNSVMFVEKQKTVEKKIKAVDDSFPDSEEDVQQILGNLADYWSKSDMQAVDYLLRMDKYRYLSQMLAGTNDYFYYGASDSDGKPDGTGLCVYAGNQYYYGHFQNGSREGTGFWYQIFVKDGAYSKANEGIYAHTYNGDWADDLPNGKGQEHLDIDVRYLDREIITNVIGTFANGYYSGDETLTSLDPQSGQKNWVGTAVNGTWKAFAEPSDVPGSTKKQIPVLRNVDNPENWFWMYTDENLGQGISAFVQEPGSENKTSTENSGK